MHEYSIMNQVVQTIIQEAEKSNLQTISLVKLAVGELSFLNEEALQFCYQVLSKDNILHGSELVIAIIKPEIECQSCGFNGDLEYLDKEDTHFRIPKFTCPKCKGEVKIIKGNGCVLQEITGETGENDEAE